MRLVGTLPVIAVGLWSLVYWWRHPDLTEVQVFQAFGWAWWWATVAAVAVLVWPLVAKVLR